MAKCDQGYLCRVCREEVEQLSDSELYLRFVIGEIDPEVLHLSPECHLACNPILSQFIDDPQFRNHTAVPVDAVPEGFRVESLDVNYAVARRELVTRGYRRLVEIQANRKRFPQVQDYLLEDFQGRWR